MYHNYVKRKKSKKKKPEFTQVKKKTALNWAKKVETNGKVIMISRE